MPPVKKLAYDPYKVLGIDSQCTDTQVDKAYKRAALKWHPDKNPTQKEKAEKMFLQIYEAYEFLKDRASRASYDAEINARFHRAQYDEQRKATSSHRRQEFITKLNRKEQAAANPTPTSTTTGGRKRRAERETETREECEEKHGLHEQIQRLRREGAEMVRKAREEMEQKRKAEIHAASQPRSQHHSQPQHHQQGGAVNFNLTDEEFARLEAEVLNFKG